MKHSQYKKYVFKIKNNMKAMKKSMEILQDKGGNLYEVEQKDLRWKTDKTNNKIKDNQGFRKHKALKKIQECKKCSYN